MLLWVQEVYHTNYHKVSISVDSFDGKKNFSGDMQRVHSVEQKYWTQLFSAGKSSWLNQQNRSVSRIHACITLIATCCLNLVAQFCASSSYGRLVGKPSHCMRARCANVAHVRASLGNFHAESASLNNLRTYIYAETMFNASRPSPPPLPVMATVVRYHVQRTTLNGKFRGTTV